MNKLAKGTIAAAAGTVLLLGGLGSLAYWNDSVAITGGTINAGELELEVTDDEWDIDIADFVWVPGDQATYTATLTLTTAGDNIQGELTVDDDSLFPSSAIADQFEIELAPDGLAVVPATGTLDYTAGVFEFDGPGVYEIPVTVTVTFLYDLLDEQNSSQNLVLDLDDLAFLVTQTAAAGAITTP